MFKNKPDMPLATEIVATDRNGMPSSTKIRFGMKSNSVCTRKGAKKTAGPPRPRANTQYAARRVMIVMVRLLEVSAHHLGERLNPKSLLAALLRIDSLSQSERREIIERLGPDVDVFRSFLSEGLLKVLNSTQGDPVSLAPHLRKILRGPLGSACWAKDVTENQMSNAVSSNLLQMAFGLFRGPKASRGIVAWGPEGEPDKVTESAKPAEGRMEKVPILQRSSRHPSEDISIWATIEDPNSKPAVPATKRQFVAGGTSVRLL